MYIRCCASVPECYQTCRYILPIASSIVVTKRVTSPPVKKKTLDNLSVPCASFLAYSQGDSTDYIELTDYRP